MREIWNVSRPWPIGSVYLSANSAKVRETTDLDRLRPTRSSNCCVPKGRASPYCKDLRSDPIGPRRVTHDSAIHDERGGTRESDRLCHASPDHDPDAGRGPHQ